MICRRVYARPPTRCVRRVADFAVSRRSTQDPCVPVPHSLRSAGAPAGGAVLDPHEHRRASTGHLPPAATPYSDFTSCGRHLRVSFAPTSSDARQDTARTLQLYIRTSGRANRAICGAHRAHRQAACGDVESAPALRLHAAAGTAAAVGLSGVRSPARIHAKPCRRRRRQELRAVGLLLLCARWLGVSVPTAHATAATRPVTELQAS
jgi:hypothetical protein